MAQEIRIPDIGDIDEVEVIEVCVRPGDQVSVGDALVVIESDKASMEVPAEVSGRVEAVLVNVGDTVGEGDPIASLVADDEADDQNDDAAGDETSDQAEASPATTEPATDKDSADEPSSDGPPSAADSKEDSKQDSEDTSEAVSERPAAQDGPGASDRSASAGKGDGSPLTLEIRVPDIGEATDVTVIEVAVQPGQTVADDDLLVVVESDKASMEIPAGHAGKVLEVHVSEGSAVEEGTLLATLETAQAKDADAPKQSQAPSGRTSAARESDPNAEQTASEEVPRAEVDRPAQGSGIYAGPAVRRLARELGVDLSAVEGSGSRGRIVKDDVKGFVKDRMTASRESPERSGVGIPPIPQVDFGKFGETETVALSKIRAVGAANLHRSWLNIPHVTQHDEADITALEDFRASLKDEANRRGVKITPLAFIIKACCYTLKEFPTFNASLDAEMEHFVLKRYYNIGVAVDTPDGLVVPVIKEADRKGVWELSEEIAELAEKSRTKKLGMSDMQGGSFSVSSLGAIGGTGFTPIINAPEVAILGVARLARRPVWDGEAFVARKMLPLSLSYDHRAINGAEAGRFVSHLTELLSDIRRLSL